MHRDRVGVGLRPGGEVFGDAAMEPPPPCGGDTFVQRLPDECMSEGCPAAVAALDHHMRRLRLADGDEEGLFVHFPDRRP